LKGKESNPNNPYNFGSKPPHDQVEGELEIGNNLGVALNFTRHLAMLKAADLAKVECHVIDDMVRIVSQTFKHFNAFGDYKIYNDGGRLNVRWDGTNVDWETYGNEKRTDPRADMDPEEKNVSIPTPQQLENDARWRFSQFVGFLGDFVNLFISDPLEAVKNHPHVKQLNRSGKGRVHINEDGSVLMQTVGEIGMEKVCRISVPLEQFPEYYPDGDKIFETPYPPELDPLKIWDFGKSGGPGKEKNSHYNIYQIRKYVKWFSNKYSKAQFLRLQKDWKVPSEYEVPEPDRQSQKQEDKALVNNGIPNPPIEAYATVRIQKDGSILILDAYDNSIVMSKGGVQLASTNNVQIEAAGSINMMAGRDINMSARNNIDLTAVQKGISIRSKTFFQQYCEKGGILFETDQVSDGRVYDAEDNPDANHDDESRIEGIYFKTNYSSIRVEAGVDLGLKTTQGSILATTGQDFAISTGSRFQVNDTLEVWNTKTRSAAEHDFEKPFTEPAGEPDNDGLGVVRIDGQCILAKVYTNYLVQYADDFRPMLCGCTDDEEPPNKLPIKDCVVNPANGKWWSENKKKGTFCHPGHVLTTRKEKFPTDIGETDALEYKKHRSTGKFKHRSIAEYGTIGATDPQSSEALYQTVTQQALYNELHNTELIKTEYSTWNFFTEIKLFDSDRRAAWPGKDIKFLKLDFGDSPGDPKLWSPDYTDPLDYLNYADPLLPDNIILKHIKDKL
jgi:hypothetical protein